MTVQSYVKTMQSDVLIYGNYAGDPYFLGFVAIVDGEVKEFTSVPVLFRKVACVKCPPDEAPHIHVI